MRYVWLTLFLAAALFLAACGGGNSTRYFRVLIPASNARPDSCYQAQSLAAPMNADEAAAQSFCGVGKKPSGNGTTNNLSIAQAWTMVDVGDGKLYLVTTTGNTSFGIEGAFTDGKYVFTGTSTELSRQCPSGTPGVVECNGACVNTRSDAANCGACGRPCATGMACRNSACVAMCPSTPMTCNAAMTDLENDALNCGFCGNACPTGQVCSGRVCVAPCAATCSDRYAASDCGMPREFTETNDAKFEFTVSGGALTGTTTSTQSFACMQSGCSADFGQRCPTCVQTTNVVGRELDNVTEFEQR